MILFRVTKAPDGLWIAQRWELDGNELTLAKESASDTRAYAFGHYEHFQIEALQEAGF